MNKWIHVNDRLPEDDQQVILFSNGVVQMAMFYLSNETDRMAWHSLNSDISGDVFYLQDEDSWTPLPKPPELLEDKS